MKSVTQLIVASRDTRKPECRTRDVAKMSHTRCQRRCRAQGKEECDTLIQKVVTLKFKVRQHFGSECDDTKILQKKLQLGHTSSIADDTSSLKHLQVFRSSTKMTRFTKMAMLPEKNPPCSAQTSVSNKLIVPHFDTSTLTFV